VFRTRGSGGSAFLLSTFDREDHHRRAANGAVGALAGIDAVWLDGALRADAPAMSRVVEVRSEALTFTGATTDMARLRITYDTSGQPGPASMIAKVRGRDDLRRQMDAVMGLFSREARFYGELAASVPIRTPRALVLGDGDEHPPGAGGPRPSATRRPESGPQCG